MDAPPTWLFILAGMPLIFVMTRMRILAKFILHGLGIGGALDAVTSDNTCFIIAYLVLQAVLRLYVEGPRSMALYRR